jgi:CubicO group peptidase (beta-lactamase class C family)
MSSIHPWPTDLEAASPALQRAVDEVLAQPEGLGVTQALLVAQGGRIIAEGYGPETTADTTLISWSMAKSVTQNLFGLMVADGLLSIDDRAPIAEWADDERAAITIADLLAMRSGLRFVEDYVDDSISHCIDMLFGTGKDDVAGYAASQPLEHPIGSLFSYSSGTTNILCRIASQLLGPGSQGVGRYLNDRLFGPLGMTSAIPKFDAVGTFIGSSFLYCTARDFARFGEFNRLDGVWGGQRLLPEGWVSYARTPTPVPETENYGYGAHWWLWPWTDSFAAHGFEGQRILIVPEAELVVVRLGKTPESANPALRSALEAIVDAVLGSNASFLGRSRGALSSSSVVGSVVGSPS